MAQMRNGCRQTSGDFLFLPTCLKLHFENNCFNFGASPLSMTLRSRQGLVKNDLDLVICPSPKWTSDRKRSATNTCSSTFSREDWHDEFVLQAQGAFSSNDENATKGLQDRRDRISLLWSERVHCCWTDQLTVYRARNLVCTVLKSSNTASSCIYTMFFWTKAYPKAKTESKRSRTKMRAQLSTQNSSTIWVNNSNSLYFSGAPTAILFHTYMQMYWITCYDNEQISTNKRSRLINSSFVDAASRNKFDLMQQTHDICSKQIFRYKDSSW